MPNFPYYGFPFSPYRRYNYNPYIISDKSNNIKTNSTSVYKEKILTENTSSKSDIPKDDINNDPYLFDLFGLKLYFDDILLVCLIFFLYNEGVKDEGLFFALILLLLT